MSSSLFRTRLRSPTLRWDPIGGVKPASSLGFFDRHFLRNSPFLEHGGQWQLCWRWSIFVHWSNMMFTRPFAPEISWFQATVAPLRGCKPTRKMTELFPRNSRKIGGTAQNFTVSISAFDMLVGGNQQFLEAMMMSIFASKGSHDFARLSGLAWK